VLPPFVGVAVKVMEVSAHTGFADATTDTLTGYDGVTTIVIVFDDAGLPEAQLIFDANMQFTWSLFAGT